MPSVTLHTQDRSSHVHHDTVSSNMPTLLQTPSGLAILEIQGRIHAPFPQEEDADLFSIDSARQRSQTSIGKLEFPLFDPDADVNDQKWMKRVYLYVGKNQRLTGEVKKLPKSLAILSKRIEANDCSLPDPEKREQQNDELEILEIIKHKIMFGGRPEPVGD